MCLPSSLAGGRSEWQPRHHRPQSLDGRHGRSLRCQVRRPHTDDTAAFQLALSNFNQLGYGKLFVPYTGNPCYIKGFNASLAPANVTGFSYASPSLTITFSSGLQLPQWLFNFGVGAPATIYGVTTASGYNNFWTVTSVNGGATPSIVLYNTYGTSISGTPTLTSAYISIGLWTSAIVSIEGECTTRFSGGSCSGLTTVTTTTGVSESPIYLISSVPCTSNAPTACQTTAQQNTNALSVRNLDFKANQNKLTGGGLALGGVFIQGANGFEVYDDDFEGFSGSAYVAVSGAPLGAGAGLTLDGGGGGGNYDQNGYVANNKFINVEYGITTRNLVSSTTFVINHVVCQSSTSN